MGRRPNGVRAMTNAEHQALYRRRRKLEQVRQDTEYSDMSHSLQEVQREMKTLEYRLSLQETEDVYAQLRAENDRLKTANYRLSTENRRLKDQNHNLKTDEIELRRQLYVAEKRRVSKLDDRDRELLIKLLGMLGSDHKGERDNASRAIEKLRKNIGKSWDDII